jgi:hypothetical protein
MLPGVQKIHYTPYFSPLVDWHVFSPEHSFQGPDSPGWDLKLDPFDMMDSEGMSEDTYEDTSEDMLTTKAPPPTSMGLDNQLSKNHSIHVVAAVENSDHHVNSVSRLIYEGLMANVSERRRPNPANPKGLVRAMYVAGEECQARSDRSVKVSNKGYQCLQS